VKKYTKILLVTGIGAGCTGDAIVEEARPKAVFLKIKNISGDKVCGKIWLPIAALKREDVDTYSLEPWFQPDDRQNSVLKEASQLN